MGNYTQFCTHKDISVNDCGQFYRAPGSPHISTMPVLLMNLNSTACTRFTFTIDRNYSNTSWHQINFTSDLLIIIIFQDMLI